MNKVLFKKVFFCSSMPCGSVCLLGHYDPSITEYCQKGTEASLFPQLLPLLIPDKSHMSTEPRDNSSAKEVAPCFIVFHSSVILPRDQDKEFSQQLATLCSNYVFYIRFAHQFASQWGECFSSLLKRKYQLFIATPGNNEWLQVPLNSMSPSKQIYKQSFSTRVLQHA